MDRSSFYLEIAVISGHILVELGEAVQPVLSWGLQARFLADGARLTPFLGSPNSCWNLNRMYKDGSRGISLTQCLLKQIVLIRYFSL
jgi:hypothetical protein